MLNDAQYFHTLTIIITMNASGSLLEEHLPHLSLGSHNFAV